MTSAVISEMISGQVDYTVRTDSRIGEKDAAGFDFQELMSNRQPDTSKTVSVADTGRAEPDSKQESFAYDKNLKSERSQVKEPVDRTQDSNVAEDVKDAVEDFTEDVKSELKEAFSMTEEELEEAMNKLGLTVMDLLNPENLTNLITELKGLSDVTELLTDSSVSTFLKEFQELTEELMTNLPEGITPEEADRLMSEEPLQTVDLKMPESEFKITDAEELLQEMSPETKTQTNIELAGSEKTQNESLEGNLPKEQTGETKEPLKAEEAVMQNAQTAKATGEELVSATVNPESVSKEIQKEQPNELTNMSEAETNEEAVEVKNLQTDAAGGKASDEEQNQNGREKNPLEAKTGTENLVFTGTKEVSSQPTEMSGQVFHTTYQPDFDVEDVIRQITEFTKINVSSESSTIEMQLNPENLGKVWIHVTEKEGAVTAQIQTQNEEVKTALEAQIAQLKNSLEGQGVKVTSVEVTIASNEFERNLDQNGTGQEKEQSEKEQGMGKIRKNINLNDLAGLQGLMTEEELLTAKIMRDNGNTIDMTA